MSIFSRVHGLWRRFFDRDRQERELDHELRSYLELAEQRYLEQGLRQKEAQRAARLELGGIEQVKESVRSAWLGAAVEGLLRDIRYGLRALGRNPTFTAAAVLTLALGIGANTAIFSLVNAVLLRPLPYEDSDRLALVWFRYDDAGQTRNPASAPELLDLRERSRLFKDFAGIWANTGALTGDGDPEQVQVGFTTSNFFEVLGAHPVLGRAFLAEEEGEGEGGAVVLSDGLWRRRYGADPGILGTEIEYDGHAVTVVGVMPPGFHLAFPTDSNIPSTLEIWLPFSWDASAMPRDLSFIRVLGRLRQDVELAEAKEELKAIAGGLREEFIRYHEIGLGLEPVALQADTVREIRPALLALFGGVGLVLLIACSNVANLQLSRFGTRRREIALRAALGASHGRIARQLLIESLVLAILGGIAALPLGWLLLGLAKKLHPPGLEALATVSLDLPVLAFTLGLSLITGLLFGLAPMVQASRPAKGGRLAQRGDPTAGRGQFRELLIVTEFALGFMLLSGAGLLIKSLVHTLESDPGFQARGALTFQVSLPRIRYPGDQERSGFARQLSAELRSLPGVEQVGAVSHLPLDDVSNWYGFVFADGANTEQRSSTLADQRATTPGYFRAMGAELIAGRWFEPSDEPAGGRVAIIDQKLANQLWPDGDVVGRGLHLEAYQNGAFVPVRTEVVGVVRHLRHHDLTDELRGQAYLPHTQSARPVLSFVLRTAMEPTSLAEPAATVLRGLDAQLPMAKLSPLSDYFDQATAAAKFTSSLGAVFAATALLLATIGIYGVLSFIVMQRRREIGVRMALGARAGEILSLVLGRGCKAAVAGLLVGLLGALGFGHLLAGLLYGVKATDPPILAGASALLLVVAMLASLVPALQAVRVDPSISLRHE